MSDKKITLPKEYQALNESDFPMVIGGINYKSKQELALRYESDLAAFAQLLYEIWQSKK